MVCDLSISGKLTWSLFPALSILLVWLVFFPVVLYGQRGIFWGLLALSLSLLPFLYRGDRREPFYTGKKAPLGFGAGRFYALSPSRASSSVSMVSP